uniref:Uncharacterized protein n=1 Tax=Aegilops tauschii subsp. strangulata TaxID=200361 RepID=A0A453RIG3_AEGTS
MGSSRPAAAEVLVLVIHAAEILKIVLISRRNFCVQSVRCSIFRQYPRLFNLLILSGLDQ